MQFTVTFRHMEPSEKLKEYGRDKLARLEKYLDKVLNAEVTLSVEKFRHRAEALIVSDGLKIQAAEETEDMYSSLDMLVDKLEKQIKRRREKLKDHKGAAPKKTARPEAESGDGPPVEETEAPFIDRRHTVRPETMTSAEAVARLDAAGQVVFIDAVDGSLSILRQTPGGRLELTTVAGPAGPA